MCLVTRTGCDPTISYSSDWLAKPNHLPWKCFCSLVNKNLNKQTEKIYVHINIGFILLMLKRRKKNTNKCVCVSFFSSSNFGSKPWSNVRTVCACVQTHHFYDESQFKCSGTWIIFIWFNERKTPPQTLCITIQSTMRRKEQKF